MIAVFTDVWHTEGSETFVVLFDAAGPAIMYDYSIPVVASPHVPVHKAHLVLRLRKAFNGSVSEARAAGSSGRTWRTVVICCPFGYSECQRLDLE